MFQILICFPHCWYCVGVISSAGGRDCNDFKEIWAVVRSEDLFCFFFSR